ncbi:MAG: hypothetical protein WCV68_00020 [Candidatus Paceibacterota bacterium]|jgi:hypothetical protein
MSKPIRELTNAEIIDNEGHFDNCLLLNIPHTRYSLYCVKQAEDDWAVFMLDMMSTDRELVNEHMTNEVLAKTISHILDQK